MREGLRDGRAAAVAAAAGGSGGWGVQREEGEKGREGGERSGREGGGRRRGKRAGLVESRIAQNREALNKNPNREACQSCNALVV